MPGSDPTVPAAAWFDALSDSELLEELVLLVQKTDGGDRRPMLLKAAHYADALYVQRQGGHLCIEDIEILREYPLL
jgi:hypothetical protein